MTAGSDLPRLKVRLTAAAERAVQSGHPWVYADKIRSSNRPGRTGDFAFIYDRRDRLMAIGLYDAGSPIRIRVFHRGKPTPVDSGFWRERLLEAWCKRRNHFGSETNAFRVVNGDSEGVPGLVLDRYEHSFVMKVYSAAWLPQLEMWRDLIVSELQPDRLVVRFSRNIQETLKPDGRWRDGGLLKGEPFTGPILFLENGLRFEADPVHGQKTGFFLDQRENRERVRTISRGATMLNIFSHSGAFSIYAAAGGAVAATDLDISPRALEEARRHFQLNSNVESISRCEHTTVQANAFHWLADVRTKLRYDLVVIDPPSLAKRAADREEALRAYHKLARSGSQLVKPGGILVMASCTAQVSREIFFQTVESAVSIKGSEWQLLERTGHAFDHPATFPEAHYLKCLFLRKTR